MKRAVKVQREESLSDYKYRIKSSSKNNKRKFKSSIHNYILFKEYLENNKPKLKRHLRYTEMVSVCKRVLELQVQELINGYIIELPRMIGKIYLIKFKSNTRKIDWDKTLQAWYYYPEFEKNKLKIYNEFSNPYVYKVKFERYGRVPLEVYYYEFETNRNLKKMILNSIKEHKNIIAYEQ